MSDRHACHMLHTWTPMLLKKTAMYNPIPRLTFLTTRGKLEYSPRVPKATSSPLPTFALFTKQKILHNSEEGTNASYVPT